MGNTYKPIFIGHRHSSKDLISLKGDFSDQGFKTAFVKILDVDV